MEYTGQICEVSPFLDKYDPVQEIPVARCCTVWTSKSTGQDHLLVGDEMLWFGTSLTHSLINPNQMRANHIEVFDDPYQKNSLFGIETEQDFIPFDTTGTIVHFESRTPSDWEKTHLPIIVLTADHWDPSGIEMRSGHPTREVAEMNTI